MLVLKKTYDALQSKYETLEQEYSALMYEFEEFMKEYDKKFATDKEKEELKLYKAQYQNALDSLAAAKRLAQNNQNEIYKYIYENNKLLKRCADLEDEVIILRNTRQTKTENTSTGFTQTELKRLIGLIHPDKHDNKPSSIELTQKVLKMMGK